MQTLKNRINYENLVTLIKSSDFLGADLIQNWINNLSKIPEDFYDLIYKTFLEAKRKTDEVYVEIELSRDADGMYKKLLNSKISEIVQTSNSQKLKQMDSSVNV